MGVAAYNRGTAVLSREIDARARAVEFEIMDRLNALEKYPDAGNPFMTVVFASSGSQWWVLDPRKGFAGFGFCYLSLHEAVRRWNVTITGFDKGRWIGEPTRGRR